MNADMLKHWLNALYLDTNNIQKMEQAYVDSVMGSLRLHSFLNDRRFVELEKYVYKSSGKHEKIADRFSYTTLPFPKELEQFFSSPEFLSLLSFITKKKFKTCEISVKKFGHRDYTLLHDSERLKLGFEFFLDINPMWNPVWGGSLIYRDAKEELFRVPPAANAFTLVNRQKGMHRFVEYVNVKSGNNVRIIVEGKLR